MNIQKFLRFKVGQKIRAYDFEPQDGRPDCYIEGIIKSSSFKTYTVHVTHDTMRDHAMTRPNLKNQLEKFPFRFEVEVPKALAWCEWSGRIKGIKETI